MAPKIPKERKEDVDVLDAVVAELKAEKKAYGSRAGDQILPQEIITTGSFEFDQRIGGGFRGSSWARFYADPECGKTSIGLRWGKNWQDKYPERGFVIYFNAEGRITKDLIDRSEINTSPERFRIIDSNSYEGILTVMERVILDNPKDRLYFFIFDSTDACERDIDKGKDFGDPEKISGGAAILSVMGKRLSILSNLSGHFIFICSQMRDTMAKGPAGGGRAPSGGNAPKFYSSLTCQIKRPWSEKYILENPSDDKSKIIGRLVEIKLDKTPNETTGSIVVYPVKYGLKGGVWRAYEAFMISEACSMLKKSKNGWFEFEESIYEDLTSRNITVPPKLQGEASMRDVFDENPELVKYVLSKAEIIYGAKKNLK